MSSIKNDVKSGDLKNLGWKDIQGTDGLYFQSSVSPMTYLQIDPTGGAFSFYGRSVKLFVNDLFVGNLYDATSGATNWHLLEGKGLNPIASVDFRNAVKPLM